MINQIITSLAALGALLAFATPQAEASDASYGYITSVFAASNGAILINTDGSRTTPLPACQGAAYGQRFAVDGSTTAGQTLASVIMTAYSLNKRISIHGSGSCTIWSDTETITYIIVES